MALAGDIAITPAPAKAATWALAFPRFCERLHLEAAAGLSGGHWLLSLGEKSPRMPKESSQSCGLVLMPLGRSAARPRAIHHQVPIGPVQSAVLLWPSSLKTQVQELLFESCPPSHAGRRFLPARSSWSHRPATVNSPPDHFWKRWSVSESRAAVHSGPQSGHISTACTLSSHSLLAHELSLQVLTMRAC